MMCIQVEQFVLLFSKPKVSSLFCLYQVNIMEVLKQLTKCSMPFQNLYFTRTCHIRRHFVISLLWLVAKERMLFGLKKKKKKKKRSAGTEEERSHCYLNKNLRSLEVELISLTSWLEFNHPNIHMYM